MVDSKSKRNKSLNSEEGINNFFSVDCLLHDTYTIWAIPLLGEFLQLLAIFPFFPGSLTRLDD